MDRCGTWLVGATWLALAAALSGCPHSEVVAEATKGEAGTSQDAGAGLPDAGKRDAGSPGSDAGLSCQQVLPIFGTLAWIVRKPDCRFAPDPRLVQPLMEFFDLQPTPSSAEVVEPSPCDLTPMNKLYYMDPSDGSLVLCPPYCKLANSWLRDHQKQATECTIGTWP